MRSAVAAISATAFVLLLSARPAWAQENGVSAREVDMSPGRDAPEASGIVTLQRLSGPINLDGLSDEPAWADIEPVTLTMYEPTFRGSSDRRVQVLVAYDNEYLYVAGRFYHDNPADIRAFSLTRDRWSGDDGFGIMLDTFNDNENGVRFVALPLGARMDMTITEGGAAGEGGGGGGSGGGGGPRNSSWNAFWDLETRFTDEGWFGEIRIPFSTLRFETLPDASVVMGMMVYAYEPAIGTRWTYPAIPQDFPYTQITAWQDVRFHDIQPSSPVYVSPYGLAGRNRFARPDGTGAAWGYTHDNQIDFGGDVKFNPNPNLTLDLTVNTDFAAVEADQQQVNLTRFSLFFDEKRPFFQERAGIFSFDTGADRGTLFYSRRIGLSDAGTPIPIHGGARLVGRAGDTDIGFISMQTAAFDTKASENFSVLRLKRRILNENSNIGAMTTMRLDGDHRYNVAYGTDALLRVLGDEYVTLKWLQTFQGGDASLDATPSGFDAGRFVFDWTRRKLGGLSYQHAFTWSGPGYVPGMGFQVRRDFTRMQSDWNYQWFPGESSALRRVWLGVGNSAWLRNANDRTGQEREFESGLVEPFVQLETKPGTTLKFSAQSQYEDVFEDFYLSDDASIRAGSYWFTEAIAEFRAPRGWSVRPNLTVTRGTFYDGQRTALQGDVSWSVDEHLELRGAWEWNRIDFSGRGQKFDSNLFRLTARGAYNMALSLDAFVQYNTLNEVLSTNTRVRYNFAEGQDLWFVWNEGINMQREILGVPTVSDFDARTLTIKYTHTFIF
jgi:hypothetical protein